MNLAVIARPLLYHTYLFQHFINSPHAGRRVLHVDRVAKGELVAYALADKLAPDGPLEDALVELQYALQCVFVGPGRHHVPHLDALVLQMNWDGLTIFVGRLDLPYHAFYVILVEKYPLVVVAHALWVGSAPQQRPLHLAYGVGLVWFGFGLGLNNRLRAGPARELFEWGKWADSAGSIWVYITL